MISYIPNRLVRRWLRLPLSLVLLLALAGTALAADPSDLPRQNLWTTDGFVNTVVLKGNTLYIGGAFFMSGQLPAAACRCIPALALSYLHFPMSRVVSRSLCPMATAAGILAAALPRWAVQTAITSPIFSLITA